MHITADDSAWITLNPFLTKEGTDSMKSLAELKTSELFLAATTNLWMTAAMSSTLDGRRISRSETATSSFFGNSILELNSAFV